jgi:hypothetical protein
MIPPITMGVFQKYGLRGLPPLDIRLPWRAPGKDVAGIFVYLGVAIRTP